MTVRKPRILGIVLVSILRILALWLGIPGLQMSNINPAAQSIWGLSFDYVEIALGIALVLFLFLLLMYKRVGLLLGIGLIVLDFVFGIATIPTANVGVLIPSGLAINLWILYYLYKYLAHEPDRAFFT